MASGKGDCSWKEDALTPDTNPHFLLRFAIAQAQTTRRIRQRKFAVEVNDFCPSCIEFRTRPTARTYFTVLHPALISR
jgi:hypothetical protein